VTGLPAWLSDVGAELRSAIGDEFRLEAEAEERAVASYRVRHRSLSDVATEMMHRGETVVVFMGDTAVAGELTHVALDLATIVTRHDRSFHVNLDARVTLGRETRRARSRGRGRNPMGCDSFLAQLRSLELSEAPVWLEADGPAGHQRGHIEAVAVDHLILVTGETEWFVPLRAVYGVWEVPT
jgi:hypothetical protein